MGLDNGIVLVTRHKLTEEEIPEYIHIDYYDDEENEKKNEFHYDVCYWRKCWNVRGKILDCEHLGNNEYDNIGSGKYDVTPACITEIIEALIGFLKDPETFFEESCIWEYEDMIPSIAKDIVNLSWLKEYLYDGKSYAYFYDSY